MEKIKLTLFFIFLFSGLLQAQINRYMVFFDDKSGTPHSISNPSTFLSNHAIQRRTNQNISTVEEDLPVTPAYVTAVRNAGATVLYKTKWMNGVLVECDASLLPSLLNLSFVSTIDYVAPGVHPGGRIKSSGKFNETTGEAAATDVQLTMLGMNEMHVAGYHGEGKLIAILDGGFNNANAIPVFQHIFSEARFDATTSFDFVRRSSNVFTGSSHGMQVWSIIGGYDPGNFIGGAYKANFVLFTTEDAATEYRVEEYNWLFAAERADSVGVDVINTSLGYTTFDDPTMNYSQSQMDGQTTVITRAANTASSKGMAVVISAGNEGNSAWGIISAPADSEVVLAVGAVTSAGVKSSFSSIGPSADGRIKPDVAALGSSVSLIATNGSISSGNGTSFAAPLITSLVADVWQMLPDLTAQEIRDTIRSRASQANNPDNFLGYGIPNFSSLVTSTEPEASVGFATVFPNPTFDYVKIELYNKAPSDQLDVSLMDSKGALHHVSVSQTNDGEFLVDISNQKPGLYVLRFQRGKQFFLHKILKIE